MRARRGARSWRPSVEIRARLAAVVGDARHALDRPGAQAGSLKSATERRRSAASWARLPIDSAVWLAPCEVCAVIDWIVFMVEVMLVAAADCRSEEHTSELQSLMRISYAVFGLKKKNT